MPQRQRPVRHEEASRQRARLCRRTRLSLASIPTSHQTNSCSDYRFKENMMTTASTKARARKLTIGVLSQETGVNIETIRYYERIGLISEPPRSEGGHRVYDIMHRQRLIFIRRARELGFPLDDVRNLLGLERSQSLTCEEVKALTERHIAEIREKIGDLKRLERVLSELTAQCHGGKVPACPILDVLGATAALKLGRDALSDGGLAGSVFTASERVGPSQLWTA